MEEKTSFTPNEVQKIISEMAEQNNIAWTMAVKSFVPDEKLVAQIALQYVANCMMMFVGQVAEEIEVQASTEKFDTELKEILNDEE
jgi:hypothetical protein